MCHPVTTFTSGNGEYQVLWLLTLTSQVKDMSVVNRIWPSYGSIHTATNDTDVQIPNPRLSLWCNHCIWNTAMFPNLSNPQNAVPTFLTLHIMFYVIIFNIHITQVCLFSWAPKHGATQPQKTSGWNDIMLWYTHHRLKNTGMKERH